MSSVMSNRFRGALIGVLVGDCFGAPFECRPVNANNLAEVITKMTSASDESLKYTDDTVMTMSTCKSLIACNGLDPRHLAQQFATDYYREPRRGYGAAIGQVFSLLRDTLYQDPYGPATTQFNGSGSYGNGAAMRCNGIALFSHSRKLNERQTLDLVENCSRITHSHVYGINGAILLVYALRYVLELESDELDETLFLGHLMTKMKDIEEGKEGVYSKKLQEIKKVLEELSVSGKDVDQREIVCLLGNNVTAHHSVPLAIYSFLRGVSKFTDAYRLENEFIRTLHWAISCGGDTDTIASMACGLSGAYLGLNKIPDNLYKKCESWQVMLSLADQLARE